MFGGVGDGDYQLTNVFNYYYLGAVGFGTNREAMNIIWDTGSSWTIVEGYTCSTCEGTLYDYSDEETAGTFIDNGNEGSRNYGSASTNGFEAIDQVCLLNI